MDIETFISDLKESKNKLLSGDAADLQRWDMLRHTKQGLETFLNFNIAKITFETAKKTESTIICTSNTTFIKLFSVAKASDVKKIAKIKSKGLISKQPNQVLTWNLLENKYCTIPLKSWYIHPFEWVTISPKNIEVLHKVTNDLLK